MAKKAQQVSIWTEQADFISYYASGSVEASGYLEYVDEYGDGNGRYDLYDGELGLINSFNRLYV